MVRYSAGVCWDCPCALSAGRKSEGADLLLLSRQNSNSEGVGDVTPELEALS